MKIHFAPPPLPHTLPAHVVLANRLVRTLKRRPGQTDEERGEAYRRDLRILYEKLRPWFESPLPLSSSVNFFAPPLSHRV